MQYYKSRVSIVAPLSNPNSEKILQKHICQIEAVLREYIVAPKEITYIGTSSHVYIDHIP